LAVLFNEARRGSREQALKGAAKETEIMMWGADLEGVANLAKARHADMLADAMQRQHQRRLLRGGTQKLGAWQRLRQIVLGRQLQERPREPYPAQHSLQHS
jgi:hypothetical protein